MVSLCNVATRCSLEFSAKCKIRVLAELANSMCVLCLGPLSCHMTLERLAFFELHSVGVQHLALIDVTDEKCRFQWVVVFKRARVVVVGEGEV